MGLIAGPQAPARTRPQIGPAWPSYPPAIETIHRPAWMNAVAIVGTPTTSGGTATVARPSGGVPGNVYILTIEEFNNVGSAHALVGFTQIDTQKTQGAVKLSAWWRIHDGTELSTFTPTGFISTQTNMGVWLLSGNDTTTPVLAGLITQRTGTNHVTGTIDTTGVDGCMLLCAFGTDGTSITRPSGMTSDWNTDGGDWDGSHVIQTTGGSVSKTCTTSSINGVNLIVAIQPPAGGAVVAPQRAYIVRQAVRRASTR